MGSVLVGEQQLKRPRSVASDAVCSRTRGATLENPGEPPGAGGEASGCFQAETR